MFAEVKGLIKVGSILHEGWLLHWWQSRAVLSDDAHFLFNTEITPTDPIIFCFGTRADVGARFCSMLSPLTWGF